MSWCISAVANGLKRAWAPPVTQVRYRFHKDKIEAGPLVRRYGYEEKILQRGMLPHVKHEKHLPHKQYIPEDNWGEKRALFGQNDYIDIFTGNIHPTRVLYDVPQWIRGVQGNEYQMLLRKRLMLRGGAFRDRPEKWRNTIKRVHYLYRYLNRKTRTWFIYGNKVKP